MVSRNVPSDHMFKQEIYIYMEITNQKNRVKQGS